MFFILFYLTATAQHSRDPFYAKQQITLQHDNDFLLSTDRYYTTGSFVKYRKLLNEASESNNKRQLSISLEQSFYTPTNRISPNIDDYDRPYAGFLGFNSALSFINSKRILDFTLAIGVTGEISGSEGLQNWFHSTNDSQIAQWEGQIENNTHANLYGRYIREWKVYQGDVGVYLNTQPTIALGTKDYYLENETKVFIGKRNDLPNSMAYSQLGTITNELFFAIKGAYRFVIHDAMLQGSIISDNSEFTLEPNQNLFSYGAEAYWRTRRMDFMVAFTRLSNRTTTTSSHGYTTFSISRNF